jgi:hypothetical protein
MAERMTYETTEVGQIYTLNSGSTYHRYPPLDRQLVMVLEKHEQSVLVVVISGPEANTEGCVNYNQLTQ